MKEVKAKLGYDPDACVFYVGLSPTLDLKEHNLVKTDAKVLFNLQGDEIADVRIVLPEDKFDFLKKLGEDPVACPVCATLKDLRSRLSKVKEVAETGKAEESKEENVETEEKTKEKESVEERKEEEKTEAAKPVESKQASKKELYKKILLLELLS